VCLAAEAGAYCLADPPSNVPYPSFTTLPVTYQVSDTLTDPAILAAIDAAFSAWGNVDCSKLKFTKGAQFKPCLSGSCTAGSVPFDPGDNSVKGIYVFWVTDAWAGFDNKNNPSTPFASNIFYWHDSIGGIVGASIAINAKDYDFSADISGGCTGAVFDVRDFVMPLIGGVIGLAKSYTSPSVMDGVLKYCSTDHHNLTQDDINGLLYHYSDGTCPAPPPPDSGCGNSPPPPPPGDGGTAPSGDGGTVPSGDGGTVPSGDGGLPPVSGDGASAGGEAGVNPPPPAEDSGCCRVGHARGQLNGVPTALLVLLVLGLVLRSRRR
jgi:hypothetical protein